jgi:hypothetical protein
VDGPWGGEKNKEEKKKTEDAKIENERIFSLESRKD